MSAGNELEKLEARNFELKAELTSLQDQINNLKRCITTTTSTQHASTLSKS